MTLFSVMLIIPFGKVPYADLWGIKLIKLSIHLSITKYEEIFLFSQKEETEKSSEIFFCQLIR